MRRVAKFSKLPEMNVMIADCNMDDIEILPVYLILTEKR